MPLLGVNIDHIASLRQARYRGNAGTLGEPDPIRAAFEAELGGADILTVHLREDRRHIQDDDLFRLRQSANLRVNLEMAASEEMIGIARRTRPHMCTLVPEGRQEVTTEGGLDVASAPERMKRTVAALKDAGIIVSAFIDAEPRQVDAAAAAGFQACELHTGPFASTFAATGGEFLNPDLAAAHQRLLDAGHRIRAAGLRFNAGHALNYVNVGPVAALPGIAELHIGHAIISRAMFSGLRQAVADMKALLNRH